MRIKNINDLNKLILNRFVDEDIEIDCDYFFKRNLLILVFKHSIGRMTKGKKVIFNYDKSRNLFSHSRKIQNFQIITLCNIYGKGYGSLFQNHEDQWFEITTESKINRSVGLGIPFSGQDSELPLLKKQLSNIKTCNFSNVLILTSGKLDLLEKRIKEWGISIDNLRILKFTPKNAKEMILYKTGDFKPQISAKKNILFNALETDIKIIAHSRILFQNNIVDELNSSFFEVATPRISFKTKKTKLNFLDIGFHTSSNSYQPNFTFSAEFIGSNHYKYFKLGNPYLDGGCNIFSENIKISPYDERYDWAESEDVAMCKRIDSEGYFIDRLNNIEAFTQTSKLSKSLKARVFSKIYDIIS